MTYGLINRIRARKWLRENEIQHKDGYVVLYKAVSHELVAGESHIPTTYTIGTDMVCEDWVDDTLCGHGFHLSPTTFDATSYRPSGYRTWCEEHDEDEFLDKYGHVRFLRCRVRLADIRPIHLDKCKVRRLTVLDEVDLRGNPVLHDNPEQAA